MNDRLQVLIEAEKSMTPPEASVERGWQALSASVALGVLPRVDVPHHLGLASAGKGGAAATLTSKSTLTLVGLLLAGAAGVYAVKAGHPEPSVSPTSVNHAFPAKTPKIVAPQPVAVPSGAPRGLAPSVVTPTTPTRLAPSTGHTDTFEQELALILRARAALASGKPGEALTALDAHQQQFPRGQFVEDRSALRALSLCAAGRIDEGRRLAQAVIRRAPHSVYVDRLGASCLRVAP